MPSKKPRAAKPRILALAGVRLSEVAAAIEWPLPGPPPLPLPVEKAIARVERRQAERSAERSGR